MGINLSVPPLNRDLNPCFPCGGCEECNVFIQAHLFPESLLSSGVALDRGLRSFAPQLSPSEL